MPVFIDSGAQISLIPSTKADGMKNLVNFPCRPLTYLSYRLMDRSAYP